MSDRIETVIAEALRCSSPFGPGGEAGSHPDWLRDWLDEVPEHLLAALKAADIAVVELPADDSKALEHFEFAHGGVRQYDPNGFGSSRWFSFDEIRTLAPALLAMLAAADAAEASR